MKEKIGKLYLLDIKKDKRCEYFLKSFEHDPFTVNYLYKNFSHLEKEVKTDKLEVANTYIVSYDGKHPIGLLHIKSLSKLGILTLHYGISPDFRRRGYGSLLLQESSTYFLKNWKDVNIIELEINKENEGSIKCAKNAGFQEEEEKNGVKIYQKKK